MFWTSNIVQIRKIWSGSSITILWGTKGRCRLSQNLLDFVFLCQMKLSSSFRDSMCGSGPNNDGFYVFISLFCFLKTTHIFGQRRGCWYLSNMTQICLDFIGSPVLDSHTPWSRTQHFYTSQQEQIRLPWDIMRNTGFIIDFIERCMKGLYQAPDGKLSQKLLLNISMCPTKFPSATSSPFNLVHT